MSDNLVRELPHDIAAEESVLGSLLLDREAIVKVASFLQPADFYRASHTEIYAAVLRLYERQTPPDYVLLCGELERVGKLQEVGGHGALISLVNRTPTAAHVEYYARSVERCAIKRRVISAGIDISAKVGYSDSDDIEGLVLSAERILAEATARRGKSGIVSLSDALMEYAATVQAREDGGGEDGEGSSSLGVPSGFSDLDRKTGGWQAGKLIIHAGRPGTGKTSLVLNEAKNAARAGHRAGIFSLEMNREELVHRFIADEARVESRKLVTQQFLTHEERQRVSRADGELADLGIYIDDTANLSISELRSKAFMMRAEYGISILFVDYLQLVTAPRRDNNRVLEVGEVARKLKILARELDIPVVACAQLSRAVESRHSHVPMLSDLRDSGEIEQHADIVIFIHRPEMYGETDLNSGLAELHIAKHRAGPLGIVPLRFAKELTQFQNMARRPGGSWDEE